MIPNSKSQAATKKQQHHQCAHRSAEPGQEAEDQADPDPDLPLRDEEVDEGHGGAFSAMPAQNPWVGLKSCLPRGRRSRTASRCSLLCRSRGIRQRTTHRLANDLFQAGPQEDDPDAYSENGHPELVSLSTTCMLDLRPRRRFAHPRIRLVGRAPPAESHEISGYRSLRTGARQRSRPTDASRRTMLPARGVGDLASTGSMRRNSSPSCPTGRPRPRSRGSFFRRRRA